MFKNLEINEELKTITKKKLEKLIKHPEKFNDDIWVSKKSIDISGNKKISSLPNNLVITAGFDISNCKNINFWFTYGLLSKNIILHA